MHKCRFSTFLVIFAYALTVVADAGNALVTFSTKGPDRYADGSVVRDNEWYALVWSPNEVFGGLTSACIPVKDTDRLYLAAPLASAGRCPTTVFQIDSKTAPSGGNYFIYLLDTRDVNGAPTINRGGDGLPLIVNGIAETSATGSGDADSALVTNSEVAGDWSETDISAIGNPRITGFAIHGDRAIIKVSGMHPSVRYNVMSGSNLNEISTTVLNLPISAESNDVTFNIDKRDGNFFKIARQPLK